MKDPQFQSDCQHGAPGQPRRQGLRLFCAMMGWAPASEQNALVITGDADIGFVAHGRRNLLAHFQFKRFIFNKSAGGTLIIDNHRSAGAAGGDDHRATRQPQRRGYDKQYGQRFFHGGGNMAASIRTDSARRTFPLAKALGNKENVGSFDISKYLEIVKIIS